MNVDHLVKMANQIGDYYGSLPDRKEALTSIATHLRRFWDPRMRRTILAHVHDVGGVGLSPLVLDAILQNQPFLTPPPALTPTAPAP